MRREHLLFVAVAGFFTALIIFIIILYKPIVPYTINLSSINSKPSAAKSDTDIINSLNSKIKSLENHLDLLTNEQKNQFTALQDVQTYISSTSAQPTPPAGGLPTTKSIISVVNTKGSLFTTSSINYTPMGMYVNVKCPKSCYLWINFFTSSQNTSTPVSAQGYIATYGIFLNESDQSTYSQASYPAASSYVPVSLNAVIPVGSGIYTVDIRTKTSGGTLQSNVSNLQVMTIER